MSVGQRRILLVVDEPSIRLLLVDSLEDAGFDVLEAANGDEAACLLVYPNDVDLVVTDIQMPGSRDGNAVAEAAKERDPEIPVVYMIANPNSLRNRVGSRDAFLKKPFPPSEVLVVVRRLLALA